MVNPDIQLDQFEHQVEFSSFIPDDCNSSVSSEYPGVVMNIILTRSIAYHLLETYLPSTLFVTLGKQIVILFFQTTTLGYFSLYIPPDSIPGRVAIGMTTIMTMETMFSGVRESVPKVNYITLLDIWMVMCLIFVNLFMFEFILVVYLNSKSKYDLSRFVEKVCRLIFPLTFIIFNILYWTFTR